MKREDEKNALTSSALQTEAETDGAADNKKVSVQETVAPDKKPRRKTGGHKPSAPDTRTSLIFWLIVLASIIISLIVSEAIFQNTGLEKMADWIQWISFGSFGAMIGFLINMLNKRSGLTSLGNKPMTSMAVKEVIGRALIGMVAGGIAADLVSGYVRPDHANVIALLFGISGIKGLLSAAAATARSIGTVIKKTVGH